MDVRAFLVANPQPSILVQPSYGAFNDPTRLAKAAAVLASLPTEYRPYQMPSQFAAMIGRVVGRITLQHIGSLLGSTPLASNRRNGLHQR